MMKIYEMSRIQLDESCFIEVWFQQYNQFSFLTTLAKFRKNPFLMSHAFFIVKTQSTIVVEALEDIHIW